jgi:hypothetical protein
VVSTPMDVAPGYLKGVAALSPREVWAVGGNGGPIIMRWDGTQWNLEATSHPGDTAELNGVSAVVSDDVWAVGRSVVGGLSQNLTMHWDGVNWSEIPSPNMGSVSNALYGVSANTSNDVWAVGQFGSVQPYIYPTELLIMHWDGRQWTIFRQQPVGQNSVLYGVTAVSANDAWAVGVYDDGTSTQGLIMHWDGTDWHDVSPYVAAVSSRLYSVVAVSADDVWAVGSYNSFHHNHEQNLAMHWDGVNWSLVSSPSVGTSYDTFFGVAAVSSSDVWAVGRYRGYPNVTKTLVEHWDGTQWQVSPTPDNGIDAHLLRGVAAVSADDIWGVGLIHKYSDPDPNHPLQRPYVLHYPDCGRGDGR